MDNDIENLFSSKCIHCRSNERVFKKRYYYEDGVSIVCSSKFYVCRNNKCPGYIEIELGMRIVIFNEQFEWELIYG